VPFDSGQTPVNRDEHKLLNNRKRAVHFGWALWVLAYIILLKLASLQGSLGDNHGNEDKRRKVWIPSRHQNAQSFFHKFGKQ
jgi:hypothetical protein